MVQREGATSGRPTRRCHVPGRRGGGGGLATSLMKARHIARLAALRPQNAPHANRRFLRKRSANDDSATENQGSP